MCKLKFDRHLIRARLISSKRILFFFRIESSEDGQKIIYERDTEYREIRLYSRAFVQTID